MSSVNLLSSMAKPVILCVDDEKTVLNGLRDELKYEFDNEYSIELAESGEEALALIEDLITSGIPLPVIVSDQIMPGMKGDEFLIAVHNRLPFTRKVLLTGQASPESVGNLVNNGALYRYVSKPWDPKELAEILREAIAEFHYDLKHRDDEQVYARRIQQALMTDIAVLQRQFPQAFVFYQPAATVAGDFYWFAERDRDLFLCVADATGRGIPGAYFSALGISSLNYLLLYGNHTTTGDVLTGLDRRVSPQLAEIAQGEEMFDGMEISLLRLRKTERQLEFSGARHDAYLLRDKTLKILEGQPHAIARLRQDEPTFVFHAHALNYQEGDVLYLFTDGMAQQPGGPEGRVLGRKNLLAHLERICTLPVEQQKSTLSEYMASWAEGREQRDDYLLLGLVF